MTRVLLVDDDESIRGLMRTILQDLAYEIIEAADGSEALHTLKGWEPDLVVLDVLMPVMSGLEVLQEMRHLVMKKRPRIIMLTAKTGETDFVTGYRLGADIYLTKPFNPEDLVRAIEEILRLSPKQIDSRRQNEIDKAQLFKSVEQSFPTRKVD